MKIFLIYPAIDSLQNTGYNHGLGYISSVLKEGGFDVDYLVLKNKEDIAGLYEIVRGKKPEIVGFSVTTSQFNHLKDITKALKEISNSFMVCGGIHPTLRPECIFELPYVDAIVRGEGEYPLLEFAQRLENKIDYLNIKNFWFRKNNKIIKNGLRPLIKNLDSLPFPDKSSLDYQRVINEAQGVNPFMFSRGCTFGCSYCSNSALSKLYQENFFRQLSPQRAIQEIKQDADRFKFKFIVFDDDIISLNKKWFYEFFTLYKNNFGYPFACNIRVGTVDSDMMGLLKNAGAFYIIIGIEHGNEKFTKTVLKRNITNKQIIDTFKLCDKYELPYYGQVMVGLPFENKRLYVDTVRLCRKISIENPISIFYPYPGTELGKICEENKWLPQKEFYKERVEATISYPDFSKENIQLCADVFPILMRFKFIPLFIPLEWILWISNAVKRIRNLGIGINRHTRLKRP